MQRFLVGLLGLLFLVACRHVPDDVIPEKKMVNVLTDLHLIEGYLMSMPQDSMQLVARQYYQAIYEKYNTDSLGVYNSIAYYSNDPTVLDKMYEEVQQRLSALEQEEQTKTETKMRQQFVKDSLYSARLSDSVRRVALDSARRRWSDKLVFIDSLDQAVVDTSLSKSDSIPPIGKKDQWLHQQDRLLQYLGAGKLVLPFLTIDLVISTAPSKGTSAPTVPPNLKPNKPIGKPEQLKEEE